jgi:hypothetical protein
VIQVWRLSLYAAVFFLRDQLCRRKGIGHVNRFHNNGDEWYCRNSWVFSFFGLVAFQLIATAVAGGEGSISIKNKLATQKNAREL